MPRLPDGDQPPATGKLPAAALRRGAARPLGIYVHVPFCTTRCGYCDFNTYTAAELSGGATRGGYVDAALAEVELAARSLGEHVRPASTVFFGGGTPTLLGADDLVALLNGIDERIGVAPGAEVTTEANPETVDAALLGRLREGGFTRLSLGMQSAAAHVLATLDRVHTPGRAERAARDAHAAGFAHVSLDLIYGTPGERPDDWTATLDAALSAEPDHISAYALVAEPGTRLHAKIARGTLAAVDDDVLAERYQAADERFAAAGLPWYEVSNWARDDAARCAHNLGYWRGDDWWGIGPGAHSHIGGVRWWNALHPSRWTAALRAGVSPAAGREELDATTRDNERLMLAPRLAEGLATTLLSPTAIEALPALARDGLIDRAALADGRIVATLDGRLKADTITRALWRD